MVSAFGVNTAVRAFAASSDCSLSIAKKPTTARRSLLLLQPALVLLMKLRTSSEGERNYLWLANITFHREWLTCSVEDGTLAGLPRPPAATLHSSAEAPAMDWGNGERANLRQCADQTQGLLSVGRLRPGLDIAAVTARTGRALQRHTRRAATCRAAGRSSFLERAGDGATSMPAASTVRLGREGGGGRWPTDRLSEHLHDARLRPKHRHPRSITTTVRSVPVSGASRRGGGEGRARGKGGRRGATHSAAGAPPRR
jgi:hypothetical protein